MLEAALASCTAGIPGTCRSCGGARAGGCRQRGSADGRPARHLPRGDGEESSDSQGRWSAVVSKPSSSHTLLRGRLRHWAALQLLPCPACSVWVFQPALQAVPAIACPLPVLPWPPQLPPKSSWVGNPAAFPIVQEAEDRAGIALPPAEGTAIFIFFNCFSLFW